MKRPTLFQIEAAIMTSLMLSAFIVGVVGLAKAVADLLGKGFR